jgi:hypothetical protein
MRSGIDLRGAQCERLRTGKIDAAMLQ